MKCPHCAVAINLELEETDAWKDPNSQDTKKGHRIAYGHCPSCGDLITLLQRGIYTRNQGQGGSSYGDIDNIYSEEIIYPKSIIRRVESEVPDRFRRDYIEACAVLAYSAKASAALGRRILQDILREHFNIKQNSLAQEIETFINRNDTPSYLAEAVDAVRNVGNFAAHPLKDTNTGEIVDVEPGEAEWILDVLDSLLDFAFVQPIRLEERKKKLNQKLKDLGKPPMKG